MSLAPAHLADVERIREATLTAIYAVDVAVLLAGLAPADRWTYAETHRRDWDKAAELPPNSVLLQLAERIPGCRADVAAKEAIHAVG